MAGASILRGWQVAVTPSMSPAKGWLEEILAKEEQHADELRTPLERLGQRP